jgi:hypothetical protein
MRTPEQVRAAIADCLRRRRARLKKIHLCQDCGSAPPKEGRTLCIDCLEDRCRREKDRSVEKILLDIAHENAIQSNFANG